MKRLPHLLLVALLLVVTGAIPGLRAASLSDEVDGPIRIGGPEPVGSTCGYSASGEENAMADAENNANQFCISMGCKNAIITTTYPSWVDAEGYTHICITFACNCPAKAA